MAPWSQPHLDTLRRLAARGDTAGKIADRVGRSSEAVLDKARQLRISVREGDRDGSSKWLAREIDRLARRVKDIESRSASARSKADAETLALKAEVCTNHMDNIRASLRRFKRYLGFAVSRLEKRLFAIKERLKDIQRRLRAKRAKWWRDYLERIKPLVSAFVAIVNLLGPFAPWALKLVAGT